MWRHSSFSFLKVEQEQECVSPRSTCQGDVKEREWIAAVTLYNIIMIKDVEVVLGS